MKIAVTNPYCWPEVRRGAERFLEDLATFFFTSGHDVTIVSTRSDAQQDDADNYDDKVERVLFRRPQRAFQIGRYVTPLHRFGLQCFSFFRRQHFDLIYCLNYHEAAAAVLANMPRKQTERPRIIYYCAGIPIARYFRSVPHDRLAFELCVRRTEFLVASSAARDYAKAEFGVAAAVFPPPVHLGRFSAKCAPRQEPVFAFVGEVDEPRKGAVALARAFAMILAELPDARLRYCGRATPERQAEIRRSVSPSVSERIDFLGIGQVHDMPRVYAAASVVALPATWEAFGLVLVEALAAGTPVVGCRHAGIPDIISDPRIGCLFDPGEVGADLETRNVAGLAQALRKAFALAQDPSTPDRCKVHAKAFSWEALAPRYHALLTRGGTA